MNTKVCPECGTTFEAKRSDAICCSDKCRSAFNYKRKERKKEILQTYSNSELNNNCKTGVELSGKLELNSLAGRIDIFEKHILRISDEIKSIENKSDLHIQQKKALKEQIVELEMGDKLKLKQRSEMSDYALYNNYLNKAYQAAKQKGDQFAKTRLITESDIQNKFNHELKLEIQNYRNSLNTKLEKLNLELKFVQDQFDDLMNIQEQNNTRISELHNELRFYEARILKYESLLSG